jgi:hypothetical protein
VQEGLCEEIGEGQATLCQEAEGQGEEESQGYEQEQEVMSIRKSFPLAVFVVVAFLVSAVLSASPASAQAAYSLKNGSVQLTGSDGSFARQAGGHPDFRVSFDFPFDATSGLLAGNARDVRVDLPVGMVGNPTAVPECPADLLVTAGDSLVGKCPPETQIGVAKLAQTPGVPTTVAVYNMAHSPELPGLFGFNFLSVPIFVQPKVRASDYGISSESARISQAKTIYSADIVIWGVPADPSHDAQRVDPTGKIPTSWNCQIDGGSACTVPSTAPRRPFLSAPTSCPGRPAVFGLVADSWENPGVFDSQTLSADADGAPLSTEGCDKLAFTPTASVRTTSHVADAPTGLDVTVSVPQNDSPDGLATAHVKRVEVTFPEGMSVSPSSAAGLGACSPAQIGLGTDSAVSCPDSARLGRVDVETPLLKDPLHGDVFLAKQTDNPFGSLIAMYVAIQGPGFVLKLPGKIDLDPNTGRVVATFDQNPQVPFSKLTVSFSGGSRAALANPPACGTYTTHVALVSWASDDVVGADSPLAIDEGCETRTFSPSLSAGTSTTQAGADAPFTVAVTRGDRSQYFSRISPVTLPAGLLARIGSVAQCGEAQANAGTCGTDSQVGSVSTLAGPGAQPLGLTGRVYLTGPYKGGPFGLSIVVPAVAGPFDLGNVVVRAAIRVDPVTAQATVESDPLPTIIDGIPLRVRQVNVTIDRKGFTFNPTSCAAKSVVAGLGGFDSLAPDAARSDVTLSSPFQANGCGDLGFAPKLSMRLTGKGQTTDGKHPALVAHLAPNTTDANSAKVTVALPLSLALDPGNANGLCEPVDAAANKCAASTVVGHATAHSILPHPLTGPVYFVRGERKDPKSGRTIKTLPKLFIPLSADGVTIYINASSDVKGNKLVTTFDTLPDAPFSSFDLQINGGKHGILAVSGANVCAGTQIADADYTGQNGKVFSDGVTMGTPCALGIVKSSHTSTALKVAVGGIGAGKLSATGKGVGRASRAIGSATTATLTMKLTKSTRSALARGRNVKVKVTVLFTPKGAKKAKRTTKTMVLHGAAKR